MSAEKAASPCNKFQANIFNKSKCQNCFKSRELHLLNEHDMEQAKPIYAGWLCLAPEGTDFDNPMQRSRKWQRRFFILYEHGSLSFALDELPSTLPQGTVNLNLCTDISDAEPRTGQRNALCIITPEQEIFIRGDNKEIINGWSEQLGVYLRTNKQNQKKKRKVEPVATQEPSPAKMAATDPSFHSSDSAAESGCGRWQEDRQGRGPCETPMWTVTDTDPPGPDQTPAVNASTYLHPLTSDSLTLDAAGFVSPVGSLDLVSSGNANSNNQLAESDNIQTPALNKNQSRDKSRCSPTERLLGWEDDRTADTRKGRSEVRGSNKREKLQSCGDEARLKAPPAPPQRRAKSLDRRTSDTVMTPDLLNFKKGWMVKLDENEQWKKYWFVLSTDSLRYYKDSIAEEASDLEGDINLTKCYNVSEYQVQRNYGFQIHTPNGVYTLSAMTAGIRRNWIQALMKNVHPANAPDVASVPGHHGLSSPPEALPKPDVTPDLAGVSADKHRTVMERRREGRYKTFDWAEFRPQKKPTSDAEPQRSKGLCSLELGDLERRKRREERRRRYESMLGISLGLEATADRRADADIRALSPKSQRKVEGEIEECWKLVETTVFRLDSSVLLLPETRDSAEMEKLLDGYRKEVEDLKAQLAESERRRLEVEAQLSTAGYHQQQLEHPLSSDFSSSDTNGKTSNSLTQTLKDTYKDNSIRPDIQEQLGSLESPQTPSIWLHDAEGNLQELEDLLPVATPLSPASDSLSPSDGETVEEPSDVATNNRQNQLNMQDTETLINNGEYGSLIEEEPADGDVNQLSCCVEHHIPPDQAVVRRLSQEVELLSSQNEALIQRNQEMLNQLTEADREIERLKAELSGRYAEPRHLPEVEQLHHTMVEDLERELSSRNQQLLEAQTLITSLEENLRETETLLQLHVREDPEETCQNDEKAPEAELTELQTLKEELKEAEELHRQTAAEAEAHIRRLNQELEMERLKDRGRGGGNRHVSDEEKTQQVMEAMVTRLNALGKLLEAIDRLDDGWRREEETTPIVASWLRREEKFWSLLLHRQESNPSQFREEQSVEVLLSEVTERMMVENQMLLLGHGLLSEAEEGRDSWDIASVTETEQKDESRISDFLCEIKHLRVVTQVKTSSLEHLAASVSSSTQLQLMVDRLSDLSEHPWSGLIHSAATEALYCCRLSRLRAKYERELEETKQRQLTSCLICSHCEELMEENKQLRDRLSNLEELLSQTSSWDDKINTQDTNIEPQVEGEGPVGEDDVQKTPEEEMVESLELECMETSPPQVEGQQVEDEIVEKTDPSVEVEQVLVLRRRVTELEEQLSVIEEELKEEFDGKMSLVQRQQESEMEKLKITCERGFASMEEYHAKVVEELQQRHQHEVERLLVARDQLLEEESAATAIAIEAIMNAHRLELEKEVQRRCQNSTGNTLLEDVYRRHREELTSSQRELQVLSQQFSLKCLENGHLVQALDAERKALCQCQQENQDLRTRNQELSGHLAAEITRLCSLAKQDALPLSQGMDVYELEITLRVKESEVQCLKQELTSLKDELQAAQRDKRNATKKYKDVYTELSILRAKTEREVDELRENLRLARRALDRTSP